MVSARSDVGDGQPAEPVAAPSGTYSPTLVDVGGVRLAAVSLGTGAPTVVLDHGLGDWWGTWKPVLPGISAFTRVVAYSRAGCGGSDPPVHVGRTSRDMVRELRVLLAALDARPPYVLVGHSFAGWNVRLFAAEHPSEVAGLVLSSVTYDDAGNLQMHSELPAEERDERLRWHYGGNPKERANIGASAAQVRAAGPLGPLPVAVLTNYRDPDSIDHPELRDADQEALGHLTPNTTWEIVHGVGHHIHRDRPDLVVGAVRSVIHRIQT